MKRLGLIGGTSWLSTVDYYSHINRMVNERLGGVSSAELVLWSVDFGVIQRNFLSGESEKNEAIFLEGSRKLEAAGAMVVLLCANTPHMFAKAIQPKIGIPILHIATAVATDLKALGMRRALILGTKMTMELEFLREGLREQGVEPMIPNEADREYLNHAIFHVFPKNMFTDEDRSRHLEIIEKGKAQGAEAAVLACTEIPILLDGVETALPKVDTTLIHAKAAVEFMLG